MTYNGWANYETWNIALWLGNDEPLYRACVARAHRAPRMTATLAKGFVSQLLNGRTPDGVSTHDGR